MNRAPAPIGLVVKSEPAPSPAAASSFSVAWAAIPLAIIACVAIAKIVLMRRATAELIAHPRKVAMRHLAKAGI